MNKFEGEIMVYIPLKEINVNQLAFQNFRDKLKNEINAIANESFLIYRNDMHVEVGNSENYIENGKAGLQTSSSRYTLAFGYRIKDELEYDDIMSQQFFNSSYIYAFVNKLLNLFHENGIKLVRNGKSYWFEHHGLLKGTLGE